jgi:hypothetical protein
MPNTQTSVPVFTAGQVLTAAQVTQINTGIPVFATTTTRDAAFGGTGEKTLAEGQFAYIEATDATQYYDGAAWQSVSVVPGLVPIVPSSVAVGSGTGTASANGQVTFTTASSVSLNGVFTSSYRNYRIVFNTTAASGTGTITIRLRASGSDITAASYLTQTLEGNGNNTPTNGIVTGQTSWPYMSLGSNADSVNAFVWDLFNPQATAYTTGVAINGNVDSGSASRIILRNYVYQVTTSADGLSFIMSANNFTGTVTIYGYNQ